MLLLEYKPLLDELGLIVKTFLLMFQQKELYHLLKTFTRMESQ